MFKILLVEDDLALRTAYEMIISMKGFSVTSAENGMIALKLIKKNKYDLILLDIMMPVLDGIGFLKKAKLRQAMPTIRIVVFSNLSSGKEVDEAEALGADRILLKSNISPLQLIDTINEELGKNKN